MSCCSGPVQEIKSLFEPWNCSPWGAVVWEPESTDRNYAMKVNLVEIAKELMRLAEACSSNEENVLSIVENIENLDSDGCFIDDPEYSIYARLANACRSVARCLLSA